MAGNINQQANPNPVGHDNDDEGFDWEDGNSSLRQSKISDNFNFDEERNSARNDNVEMQQIQQQPAQNIANQMDRQQIQHQQDPNNYNDNLNQFPPPQQQQVQQQYVQPPPIQPVQAPRPIPAPKPVQPQQPVEMATMMYWRAIIVGLIIFTCIMIVILLQVLMFIQNCVPQKNGILLNAGISITYFVLSLLSLVGLAGSLQAVNDGLKTIIWWTSLTKVLYGVVIMILAILILGVESSNLDDSVNKSWSAMSQYQKDFFDNEEQNLIDVKQTNILLTGAFSLLIGVFFVIIGGIGFKYYSVIGENMKFDRKTTSRLPVPEPAFQHLHSNIDLTVAQYQEVDEHYKVLKMHIPKKKKI